MKAVVTGMIATYPVGGVAWDYGQYALGLERLGYEVYYLEDTGWQTYDPTQGEYGEDPVYGVKFLHDALGRLSPTLAKRWHFRAMDGTTFGVEQARFNQIAADAALFLNVSGGTVLRDEYMNNPCKILIDSDPGWNHFVNFPKSDRNPGWQGSHGWRGHDHFFSYAERMGRPDCILPPLGIDWKPTRPPVVLEQWQAEPPGATWSTVMTWNNFGQPIRYRGVEYGSKEREFVHVETIPQRTRASFELSVGGTNPPREHWRSLGWSVVDSETISRTTDRYRSYIQRSRGEFSVAKNVYVATRSGWFSCRSVCYLASGRPVVVQDTGFSELIPVGEGLFAFTNPAEAEAAIGAVEADYPRHRESARDIAREYFDSDRVLGDMLKRVGLR